MIRPSTLIEGSIIPALHICPLSVGHPSYILRVYITLSYRFRIFEMKSFKFHSKPNRCLRVSEN